MSTGHAKAGQTFAKATLRNSRAQELLDGLRADEDILELLENNRDVDRILWRRLENLLLEALHFLLIAPNTREALLNGELGHIARHVSAPEPAVDLLVETTDRAREVKAAMKRFVPENEFGAAETRLSKAFLQLKSHADPVLDHRSTITKLWALATPSLLEHIERAARERGDPNPSAFAASWGWRATFGVVELDADAQREVWERAVKFTANPTKSQAKNIFAAEGLRVESRFWNTKAAWSAYETTIAIIAATDAMMEHADDPTPDTALAAWIAALEAVKDLPDLAKVLTETQTVVRMAAGPGKSLLSKLASFSDSMPVAVLDGVVSVLKFEATIRATNAVLKSKTASEGDKDIAREDAMLAGVSLVVSGIGLAVGSPFVLAGTVLFVGSAVILNRSVWNACLSGIEGLPGPGRAVKLAWTEILEGVDGKRPLANLAKGTPWENKIALSVDLLRNSTSDASEVGLGAFWAVSSGDVIMTPLVAGMLRRQYGFNHDFATEVAAY